MRASTKLVMSLTAVLFVFLLGPCKASASTANCPQEPKSNVPIALGEVFAGSNCNLYTDGDIDSFVFNGTSGDIYQFAVALNGGSNDVCLAVYDPNRNQISSGCTNRFGGLTSSVVISATAQMTGTYTMEATEPASGTQNYAISLQQVYPFPPYASRVPKFDDPLPGNIAELTDTNFFTFPAYTTGTYRVTATLNGGSNDVCLNVIGPNNSSEGFGCTLRFGGGGSSVQLQFTPPQDGTTLAAVQVAGNDGTQLYTFEVACVVGNCPPPMPPPPPPCTLKDVLSYSSSTDTLTMNFTVGTNTAVTWSAWLTYQGMFVSIPGFPISQPITNPPVLITKTYTGLAAEGVVGVLSTLTTPTQGITCSSYVQINTGTGP